MTARAPRWMWDEPIKTMDDWSWPPIPDGSPQRDYTPWLPSICRVTMEFLPVEPPVDGWYTVRMQWKIWRGGALR